jgi:cyclic pyranopterin monophosphate synthase
MQDFTHIQDSVPTMVDIGGKLPTKRTACAEALVWLPPEIRDAFDGEDIRGPKGAVFQTAILAGIMAAKKTSELIPLCHALPLDDCKIKMDMEEEGVRIRCITKTEHRTGVEMEAMTGVSVAALTLYDMCKAISHDIVIGSVRLMEKSGGKNDFRR